MPVKTIQIRSQVALNPLTWYRVGVTFDGTTATLYINGAAVATAPIIKSIMPSAVQLHFGKATGGSDGLTFGEIRVWTTVRSPAQIAANLDSITPPQAGLLAMYNFNETTGATAADSSGNGHTADLGGTFQWENEDFSGAFGYAGKVEVNLSWDSILDAESYNVKRSEVEGGPYTLIGNTFWPNYTDTSVVAGTAYYYKVYAVAQGVEGAESAELSATPAAAPAETAAPKSVVVLRR